MGYIRLYRVLEGLLKNVQGRFKGYIKLIQCPFKSYIKLYRAP